MKHLGLFAFGVTTCVLVPTAVHLLDAGPKQVAKLVAPGEASIKLGHAKIEATVDRAFVDPGDKVHVTLTASADVRERVQVAVLVLESTGTSGGRVETPPDRVGRDEVTLDVPADGKATKTFAFTLPGNRGADMEGLPSFGHYTILVMTPADADALERLRRRASGVDNPMADGSGRMTAWESAWGNLGDASDSDDSKESNDTEVKPFGKPGTIARLEVVTRAKDSPISIVVPETARSGSDIAVTVKVKNRSSHPVEKLSVHLASRPDNGFGDDYLGLGEDHVKIVEDTQEVAIARRATTSVVFHVKAEQAGTLGLFARASCEDDDCYSDPGKRALNDAALDAIEIVPADPPAAAVGQK